MPTTVAAPTLEKRPPNLRSDARVRNGDTSSYIVTPYRFRVHSSVLTLMLAANRKVRISYACVFAFRENKLRQAFFGTGY
jgi:hypothetical protein